MKLASIATYMALVFVMLCGAASEATAVPIISVDTTIDLGAGVFVAPIQVADALDLISWQFDLAFDPSAVQIDEGCLQGVDPFCGDLVGPVTEGEFFVSQALFPTLFVPGFIDNVGGQLLGVAGFWQDPPPGPSGDGVLAYVRFVTIDDQRNPNLTVTGGSTGPVAVPEPTTLLLLASGLTLLAARGARRRTQG
jgi:hypothetical protein